MITTYHSSMARTPDGYIAWGEDMDSDGGHATSMQLVSAANGYNYTGDIAHFAVSGNSGVDQENTVLVLFPDAHNPADREVLFTTETNEELAIWEGAKLDKKQATAATGVTNIQWTPGFERTFLCRQKYVFYMFFLYFREQ